MKPILLIATLAFAQLALAEEAADRAAVTQLIATLNDRTAPHDQLYTSDSGESRMQLERLTGPQSEPMSETTRPFIVLNAVRFITPEVALLDATGAQYGSLYNRRVPVLLILRKSQTWQVAVVRIIAGANFLTSPGMNLVDLR